MTAAGLFRCVIPRSKRDLLHACTVASGLAIANACGGSTTTALPTGNAAEDASAILPADDAAFVDSWITSDASEAGALTSEVCASLGGTCSDAACSRSQRGVNGLCVGDALCCVTAKAFLCEDNGGICAAASSGSQACATGTSQRSGACPTNAVCCAPNGALPAIGGLCDPQTGCSGELICKDGLDTGTTTCWKNCFTDQDCPDNCECVIGAGTGLDICSAIGPGGECFP